jgi:hypothetical protein
MYLPAAMHLGSVVGGGGSTGKAMVGGGKTSTAVLTAADVSSMRAGGRQVASRTVTHVIANPAAYTREDSQSSGLEKPLLNDSGIENDLLPLDLWTSGGADDYSNGWKVLDGNLETSWDCPSQTGGEWLVFIYDPGVVVSNVVVNFAEGSATNMMMLRSLDLKEWHSCPVGTPFDTHAFLHYLWFVFPVDAAGGPRRVSEIMVNGEVLKP